VIYQIEFKPRALRDLKGIDTSAARRIVEKIKAMQDDLAGDVKRLTNSTPEFRVRVGDYRVLFSDKRKNLATRYINNDVAP
jgi:mRNA interferase RelE/StbE